MELSHALEPPNFMSPPTSDRKLDPDQIQELWLSFHSFLSTTLENYLVSRAERSLCEELKALAGSDVNLGLLPGQQVLLSQIIDGKRALSGPFTIARRDSDNPTILYLEGLDKPVSLNQLVLYHSDMDRDALEFATEPVRTSFSTSASSSLPDGIRLTELEANIHWVVYKELDPTRSPDEEPVPSGFKPFTQGQPPHHQRHAPHVGVTGMRRMTLNGLRERCDDHHHCIAKILITSGDGLRPNACNTHIEHLIFSLQSRVCMGYQGRLFSVKFPPESLVSMSLTMRAPIV
ncbi:hypothetical protein FOZ60_014553 [Perkinsus olseni]|uniref:Uncharacterized protein n=1 Tax=Perkinsus olseni TaxID=32597 RepID=A0A7J6N8A9_PEROL|nr:hypothetical protein FOZ60_014553 [Perkinsus olseni]